MKHDMKMRYHLLFEPQSEGSSVSEDIWWIRANQGHSLKVSCGWDFVVRNSSLFTNVKGRGPSTIGNHRRWPSTNGCSWDLLQGLVANW